MTDHEKGGKRPPFFIAQTNLSPKQIYRPNKFIASLAIADRNDLTVHPAALRLRFTASRNPLRDAANIRHIMIAHFP